MIEPNHQNINSQNLVSLIGQTESLIKKSLNCFDNVEVGDKVYLKRDTENLFIINSILFELNYDVNNILYIINTKKLKHFLNCLFKLN